MRAGYVGVIGQPNAGKSTLVNALVAEKVSIVSHKPQTTRQRISGIWTDNEAQVIFLDAPGVVHAETGLNFYLQEEYKSVIEDSDVLMAILNLDVQKKELAKEIVELCQKSGKPWIAIISKVDQKKEERMNALIELMSGLDVPIIKTSAKNNPQKAQDNILPLLKVLLPQTPEPLFDTEIYTTQNLRQLAAEVIREKCFYYLHQEIPYGLAIKILKFDESNPEITKIYADIIINKMSHKSMVIGTGGSTLKRIGQSARIELEQSFNIKIYLSLHVNVRAQWLKSNKALEEYGYARN